MKTTATINLIRRINIRIACLVICCCACFVVNGQVLSATSIQNMTFGAFCQGSTGGTVVISPDGSRSSTGSIVPLNLGVSYFQAIFEVEAPTGTIVTLLNGSDATLTGSNGGTMTLHIGNSNPASPFISSIAPPAKTQINIGGTLSLNEPAANPPGIYTGTFNITFNNQ